MIEDEVFPSDGSPHDIAATSNRMWGKIDDLCSDMTSVKTDIAVIKEVLEIKKEKEKQNRSLKQAGLVAGVSGLISFIVSTLRS